VLTYSPCLALQLTFRCVYVCVFVSVYAHVFCVCVCARVCVCVRPYVGHVCRACSCSLAFVLWCCSCTATDGVVTCLQGTQTSGLSCEMEVACAKACAFVHMNPYACTDTHTPCVHAPAHTSVHRPPTAPRPHHGLGPAPRWSPDPRIHDCQAQGVCHLHLL